MYLVDIPPFNPNRLALDDGLLDDCRLLNHDRLLLHDDWLLNDRWRRHNSRSRFDNHRLRVVRTHQGRSDNAADNAADESRPEIASTRSPIPAVVVVVAAVPSVMDRRRVMESSMMRSAMPATGKCPSRCRHESDCDYEFLHLIYPFLFRLKLVCRRADQSADNRADCGRAKRNPSGVPAVMVNMLDDMMTRRRWRRAMRTMPSVMRRGNRRASRQNHASHENRECLDDLVHITPATFCFRFPQRLRSNVRRTYPFSRLQRVRKPTLENLTTFMSFIYGLLHKARFTKQ